MINDWPPRKNGLTRCLSGAIIYIDQSSSDNGGNVSRSFFFKKSTDCLYRSYIASGCFPGGTYVFFTFSNASFQFSPKPISREAFNNSASHQANSLLAISTNSSGV